MNQGINHWINQLNYSSTISTILAEIPIPSGSGKVREKRCEFPMVDEFIGDDMVRYQCLLIGEMCINW